MNTLRIATRKSQLALWQAKWVKRRLEEAGYPCELITIETIGDKKLDTTIAKIGSKGVFTEELENLLMMGEADLAVHSAKDMASTLPEGFELIAFGPREDVHDVLISPRPIKLESELLVGTSSTRRVAQLARYYPHFSTVSVRGNLQTRIRKMEEGACDALLLAKAGVKRMGFDHMIQHKFDLEHLTPAAGQGSVAVEVHESLSPDLKNAIVRTVDDPRTSRLIETERMFLKAMNGGCSIPVFALAEWEDQRIHLTGGILSLDGSKEVRITGSGTTSELGNQLAVEVLKNGGESILSEIRKHLQ